MAQSVAARLHIAVETGQVREDSVQLVEAIESRSGELPSSHESRQLDANFIAGHLGQIDRGPGGELFQEPRLNRQPLNRAIMSE